MIKVKRVSNKEIHWLFPNINVGDQANCRLKQMLGEDYKSFAECKVANSGYVWSSEEDGWRPISSIDDSFERSLVEKTRATLYQRVRTLAPTMADKLMTVPNDDYIFYKVRDNGAVALLYTAWGFRNFKPDAEGEFKRVVVNDLESLTVIFVRGGVRLPNHPFEVVPNNAKQSGLTNKYVTDGAGIYDYGQHFRVGERIELIDTETGKHFLIIVEKGKTEYVLDVTQSVDVVVGVYENGMPLCGEEVVIEYADKRLTPTTNPLGQCRESIVLIPNVSCVVRVRDLEQARILISGTNDFRFDLHQQEIVCECEVIVSVSESGVPLADAPVEIRYGSINREISTDANGICRTILEVQAGTECCVKVRDVIQSRVLCAAEEYYNFDIDKEEESKSVATTNSPHIVVKDAIDQLVTSYPIIVDNNGSVVSSMTDENGVVELSEMEVGNTFVVKDGYDNANAKSYVVDASTLEYVFNLPFIMRKGEGDIVVRAIDIANNPFAGVRIKFSQNGKQYMQLLDEKGETRLAQDDFHYYYPIATNIIPTSRLIPEILFSLEKEEFEYELNEVAKGHKWWHRLFEILLGTLLFVLLLVLGIYLILLWF